MVEERGIREILFLAAGEVEGLASIVSDPVS
jgi:hypothetical protein